MQVERISYVNQSVRLDVELAINKAKQGVVLTIQGIVAQTLQSNSSILNARGNPEEVQAKAKHCAEAFFATHITEEKLADLNELSQRVKNVVSQLANRAGGELMASPMRGFLGMMTALTSQKNLIDFFLTQSIHPAQCLVEELEVRYTDDVLTQLLN